MPSSLPCRRAPCRASPGPWAQRRGRRGTEQAHRWPVRARGQPSLPRCLVCGQSATWGLKEPSGAWLGRGTSSRSECPPLLPAGGGGPVNTKLAHVPCFLTHSEFPEWASFSVNCKSFGLNMGQVGGQTLVMKSHSARLEVAVPVKT